MKPYCSFCKTEKGPLIAAPLGEVAFICEACASNCITLFIEFFRKEKAREQAENG